MTFPATIPAAALARRAVTTGLAIAMLAVGGSSAVTIAATASGAHSHPSAPATATTTASKPAGTQNGTATAFGQQVKAEVATCKSNLQSGQHGIGSCVSAFTTSSNPSNTNAGAASAHRHH